LVSNLMTWKHSGFHVFCGDPISPDDETSMENLARYIIRASISQERMTYLDQAGKVVYTSKDGTSSKEFDALEWLANICSHIPNPGQQTVRYYGYYSNVSRGKRLKQEGDDKVPSISESLGTGKAFRRNWARLIQKIYEVDPLVCPKCQGTMKVISFIEARGVIEKILKHLGLWLAKPRPPQRSALPNCEDEETSQGASASDGFFPDPEYSWYE
ncbi:MAG: transposase, partial [Candidatus Ozemobacteraceae bacterium]